VSTTQLAQLLKMPVLIEHYMEHTKKDHDLSLWTFLVLHYDHHEPDGDYDRDMQLPFMTVSDMAMIIGYFHPPLTLPAIRNEAAEDVLVSFNYRQPHIGSLYLSTIWQPPKYC